MIAINKYLLLVAVVAVSAIPTNLEGSSTTAAYQFGLRETDRQQGYRDQNGSRRGQYGFNSSGGTRQGTDINQQNGSTKQDPEDANRYTGDSLNQDHPSTLPVDASQPSGSQPGQGFNPNQYHLPGSPFNQPLAPSIPTGYQIAMVGGRYQLIPVGTYGQTSQLPSYSSSQLPTQTNSQSPSQISSQLPSQYGSQLPSHLSSQLPANQLLPQYYLPGASPAYVTSPIGQQQSPLLLTTGQLGQYGISGQTIALPNRGQIYLPGGQSLVHLTNPQPLPSDQLPGQNDSSSQDGISKVGDAYYTRRPRPQLPSDTQTLLLSQQAGAVNTLPAAYYYPTLTAQGLNQNQLHGSALGLPSAAVNPLYQPFYQTPAGTTYYTNPYSLYPASRSPLHSSTLYTVPATANQ